MTVKTNIIGNPMPQPLLSIEAARQQLMDGVSAIGATETLPLMHAFGRVLARAYHADLNVPPADNSAMDGYAVNSHGLQMGSSLPISQRIAAGQVAQPLVPGTAARIFTGAEIPAGADAVIIQEDCAVDGDRITLGAPVRPGDNIRPRGQDIQAGARLFDKGHRLDAVDVALLASVNVAEVTVYRPVRVALLSTGDELLEPGQPSAPGKIYNSNRYLLTGLLREQGYEVIDHGIVADTLPATRTALSAAAASADVIISSGGVSVGDEDHIRTAVTELGELKLWKINLKPGKPLAFGYVGTTPLVGLPGNPVSAFVTFTLLVRALLCKRQGCAFTPPQPLHLRACFNLSVRKRCEFLRGRITPAGVEIHPRQSSGALSSVAWADCLVRVNEGCGVAAGDEVEVYALS